MKEKLESRQNKVYKIEVDGEIIIEKDFSGFDRLRRELEIRKALEDAGHNVPSLIKTDGMKVYYEFLQDDTLLTLLENECIEEAAEKLALWLSRFYEITQKEYGGKMILGDIHLRNFIYHNDEIFGLDFEECMPGEIEQDIARLCAYIVTYSEPFSDYKILVAASFFNAICDLTAVNTDTFNDWLNKSFDDISSRRNQAMNEEKIIELKKKMGIF